MSERVNGLLDTIGHTLNELPSVFSTPQWGGRAYKLPGPGGRRTKPKLLAHVTLARDGKSISVSFKLPAERAEAAIDRHEWIQPHSFRSLAGSGWVSATITRKSHLRPLAHMLTESRSLHPVQDAVPEPAEVVRSAAQNAIARRLDAVMRDARADGWSPPDADDFEH